MYCPMCATQAPDEQRYCRVCGLRLEPHAKILSGQINSNEWNASQLENANRARRLLKLGYGILLGCLAVLLAFFIAEKGGEAIWGALFILALVVAVFLISGAQRTLAGIPAVRRSSGSAPPPEQTITQLPDANQSAEIPSVTEHTTKRLEPNNPADSDR